MFKKKQKKTSWLSVPAKPKRSKTKKGLVGLGLGSAAIAIVAKKRSQ